MTNKGGRKSGHDAAPSPRHAALALVVLALGLALSFLAWRLVANQLHADQAKELQRKASGAALMVADRLRDMNTMLLGLQGLFGASEEVTRREFHDYLAGFDVEEAYPEIRLISYVERVRRGDESAFVGEVRRDTSLTPLGYPHFAIRPPGERDEYWVIKFLEPMIGNEAVFGLDLAAAESRRADIIAARDGGKPVASGPFAPVVNPGEVSFTLRAPLYRRGAAPDSLAGRQQAFVGFVSAVVHVGPLLESILGGQVGIDFALRVYDIGRSQYGELEAATRDNRLYDSAGTRGPDISPAAAEPREVETIDFAGRRWLLIFTPAAAAPRATTALPPVVLGAGIAVSLLLAWLAWAMSASRARARMLAEQATAVRAAERTAEQLGFIQRLIEALPQPVFFKDAATRRYLGVNRAWEQFFGIARGRFIGKTVFELYPDDPELARRHHEKDEELLASPDSQSSYEAVVVAGGTARHAIYGKATFNDEAGRVSGIIGAITDVTGLKQTEAALRESEARFRDLTDLSSDWYWEQDVDLRFTQLSSTPEQLGEFADSGIGKTRWELPYEGVTESQWQAHREALARREPFKDFVIQRRDAKGELIVISVSGRPIFDATGRFAGYRGTGRDITAEKQAEGQIRHMAHHDALTGLPNRVLLRDRIGLAVAQSERSLRKGALLFMDLDRFKMVNDSLGHHVGDELMRAVASRLTAGVRPTDTVARVGGDEFVLLFTELSQVEDAGLIAQKVLDMFGQPFEFCGQELHATTSIGVCVYPDDGTDAETLLRNADAAMYHAKEAGRSTFQFFTSAMNVAMRERAAIERDLRRALERGEIQLHYQPQVDLRTGAIVGFEALARWSHPQRGMVPPAEFIRVAEETGLIIPIGGFVIEEACRQARAWRDAGFPRLQVAVNCSAQQFRREGMVAMVARILEKVGLPAQCLELEITESAIIHHAEQVIEWFRQLSNMGLRLSIDDFGTGYSSLSYLKRFPIRTLKIDQSFVRDVVRDKDDAAIVGAIIAMAHSLQLEVIAEGVETAGQLAHLKSLGCEKAQGYFFSRPVPAGEFAQLLRREFLPHSHDSAVG